jgi:VanZ family protein
VVYAILFAVLVLLPFDFHVPESRDELMERVGGFSGEADDLIQLWFHALLFLPLGIMLRMADPGGRPRIVRFLVWSALLSGGSEAGQILVGRSVSLGDAAADMAGAAIGYLAHGAWRRSAWLQALISGATSRPLAAVTMAAMLVGTAALVRPIHSRFDDWDPSYHVLLGDEEGGARPWKGSIREAVVFAGPSPEEGVRVFRYDTIPPAHASSGADVVLDGASLRSRSPLPDLARSIREAGAFVLTIRFTAAREDATGPARIVTYSGGTSEPNFTLGQKGRALEFRVRTTTTGANGVLPSLVVKDCVRAGSEQTAVCVSDGATSSLSLDGELLGEVRYRRYPALVGAVAAFRPGIAVTGGLLYVWWAMFGAVCNLFLRRGARTAAALSLLATVVVVLIGVL